MQAAFSQSLIVAYASCQPSLDVNSFVVKVNWGYGDNIRTTGGFL